MANPQAEKFKNDGNTAFQKGNNAEAIKLYSKAVELDPKSHVYLTNRATAYAAMQDWDKALTDSNKAIALKDDWVKGWFRKGQALVGMKKYDEAVDAYKRAVELDPKNEDITSRWKEAENLKRQNRPKVNPDGSQFTPAQIAKEEGNDFFKTGKIQDAIQAYTKALGLCKESEANEKVNIYNNRAQCYVQLYEPAKVIADCTEALNLNPMSTKALLRRGIAYESMEKMRLALDDFRKVMALDPRNQTAITASSRITQALKKAGKSVE